MTGELNVKNCCEICDVVIHQGNVILGKNVRAEQLKRVDGTFYMHPGSSAPVLEHVGKNAVICNASASELSTVLGSLLIFEGVQIPKLSRVGHDADISDGACAPALTYVGNRVFLGKGSSAPMLTHLDGHIVVDTDVTMADLPPIKVMYGVPGRALAVSTFVL